MYKLDAKQIAVELEQFWHGQHMELSDAASTFLTQWLNGGKTMPLPSEDDAQTIWAHLLETCPVPKPATSEWASFFRGCKKPVSGRIESYTLCPDSAIGLADEDGYVLCAHLDKSQVDIFDLSALCRKVATLPHIDPTLRNHILAYKGEEELLLRTEEDNCCVFRYVRSGPTLWAHK